MHDDIAAGIDLLVLDVDGVLTDGRIHIDDAHVETKAFHVRDGFAIKAWTRLGHRVAIVSGRRSEAVRTRCAELGVTHLHEGIDAKWEVVQRLLADFALDPDRTAMMGDDLPDLPVMRRVGMGICPADAAPEVRAAAHLVTERPGGAGAVREAIEHLLRARGAWDDVLAALDPATSRPAEA